MEEQTRLIRFGELTKEEPVSSLSSDFILDETVVFEAVSPFFGYYNDAPLAEKKPYIYLVLESCHSLHQVMRAVVSIRGRLTHPLVADLGSIVHNNVSLPVIRIKDIEKYCRIRHLQKYFIDEGIQLKKTYKPLDNEMVLINLQKFIQLKVEGDGLYLDADDPNKGYFVIPEYLNWEAFKELTREVKYETSILFFDAAQGVIFEHERVVDLVRIFREHLAVEKLSSIRDRYLKVLAGSALKKEPGQTI